MSIREQAANRLRKKDAALIGAVPEKKAVAIELPEDWFWRPLKRFAASFVQTSEERSAWRESGRRLQIASRIGSRLDSQQARLAYLYDREGDRGRLSGNRKTEQGQRTWQTWSR